MNNPFEQHNVSHLSASQINEFISNPQLWILHVSGYRDNNGIPAMWRGTAVDKAICSALTDPSVTDDAAEAIAVNEYAHLHARALDNGEVCSDTKVFSEQLAVPEYLRIALPHYRSLGTPLETQKKIKIELDDIPVPIIGYIDIMYDGVVRDIKTVGRLPSFVPEATCRQLAIYAKATNSIPIVDYIHCTKTTKQVVVRSVENVDRHWNLAVQAARSMMKILSISSDIKEVAGLLIPDLDDWRWSAGEKDAARRLWSMK